MIYYWNMDIYKLYFDTLFRPASICDQIRSLSLSRQNILEGTVFVACLSALLSSVMEKFVFGSTEKVNEIFSNNSIAFLFNPCNFFFEFFLFFSHVYNFWFFTWKFSRKKRDIEEIENLFLDLFCSLGFKLTTFSSRLCGCLPNFSV